MSLRCLLRLCFLSHSLTKIDWESACLLHHVIRCFLFPDVEGIILGQVLLEILQVCHLHLLTALSRPCERRTLTRWRANLSLCLKLRWLYTDESWVRFKFSIRVEIFVQMTWLLHLLLNPLLQGTEELLKMWADLILIPLLIFCKGTIRLRRELLLWKVFDLHLRCWCLWLRHKSNFFWGFTIAYYLVIALYHVTLSLHWH